MEMWDNLWAKVGDVWASIQSLTNGALIKLLLGISLMLGRSMVKEPIVTVRSFEMLWNNHHILQ